MVAIPCHCKRCEYDWDSRLPGGNPKQCPRCRSFEWRAAKSAKYVFPGPKAIAVPVAAGELKYEPVEES